MTVTKAYCYVVQRGYGRIAGFPAELDDDDRDGTKAALRHQLADTLTALGRDPHQRASLYWVEVRDFTTDQHLFDVRLAP